MEFIEKLHEDIKTGKLSEVKLFATKYPEQRLCNSESGTCALEWAIECGQFSIFSYLRANNFYTDKGSQLDEKTKHLSATEKREIRLENLNYIVNNPDSFIGLLISKCNFDACSPISPEEVQKMLFALRKNDDLKLLFQNASQVDLKFIFDFARESVENMDPTCNKNTTGIAYHKTGEVYVCKDQSEFGQYGTFTHELTHQMLFTIYENDCLPYCKGDTEREKEWAEVYQSTRNKYLSDKSGTDLIIYFVFKYRPFKNKLIELAVRVNHIMARYIEEPQKVQEISAKFPELFEFHKNNVIPDFKIPNIVQLIKLNNDFGVLEGIEQSNLKLCPLASDDRPKILQEKSGRLIVTSNVPKLALARLCLELETFSLNKLDKKVKNIFVDVEKVHQKYFENELRIHSSKSQIERLVLDVNDDKNVEKALTFITKFKSKLPILIVCSQENANKFISKGSSQLSIDFTYENLTETSQKYLQEKQIKFQGGKFKVSDFFKFDSNKNFHFLCSDEDIEINFDKNFSTMDYFIPRSIQRRYKLTGYGTQYKVEDFSISDFIRFTVSHRVVLIADVAGSGKTTSFRKVHEILLEEFPSHWVSSVSLRDFVEDLLGDFKENFQNKFMKMLKMSEIEREIFTQKFEKGEVKILFDAFDEVSPICKKTTTKLFKKFLESSEGKNQIWISTRTHLKEDLELELKVESYRLKVLSKSEQIDFLCEKWKFSHTDSYFIKTCAEKFVEKIAEIVADHPKLIGLPLIIHSVEKIFKNKINDDFEKVIKNIKITMLYDSILDECISILNSRFPKKANENTRKVTSLINAHQYQAVAYLFDEEFANRLGLIFDSDEWSLEDIARGGITRYDADQKVKFNHQTFAEHLLAIFMFNVFKNLKNSSNSQLLLLVKIMTEEKLKITRMFLNEMLENFHKKLPQILPDVEKFYKIDQDNGGRLEFLNVLAKEKFFNFFEYIFNVTKSQNLNLTSKFLGFVEDQLIRSKDFIYDDILIEVLTAIKNEELFSALLDRAFNFYGKNFFFSKKGLEEFLLRGDLNTDTLLLRLMSDKVDIKLLWIFYEKVKSKNLREEIMDKIFLFKSICGSTFLNYYICNHAKSIEKLEQILAFSEKVFDENKLKKFLRINDKLRKNVLQNSVLLDANFFILILNFLESKFTQSEMKEIINERELGMGYHVLLFAAKEAKSKIVFETLWSRIFHIIKDNVTFYMKGGAFTFSFGDNILQLSLQNKNDPEIFEFIFKLVEEYCSVEDLKAFILERNYEERDLLTLAVHFSPKSCLELLIDKITEIFGPDEVKNLLKTKQGLSDDINLLCAAIVNNKHKDSVEYFWRVLQVQFSHDEISEILNETNKNGKHILDRALEFSKSKDVFEFFWCNMVEPKMDEIKNFSRIFETSITNPMEPKIFSFLYNFMEAKCSFNENVFDKYCNLKKLLVVGAKFAKHFALKFLFDQLSIIYDEDDVKNILISIKVDVANSVSNLLSCAVVFNSNKDSIEFLWKVYEQNFSHEEISELSKMKYLTGDDDYFSEKVKKMEEFMKSKSLVLRTEKYQRETAEKIFY